MADDNSILNHCRCRTCQWWVNQPALTPEDIHPNWPQETIDQINDHRTNTGTCETPSDKIYTDCGENTIRTTADFGCVVWEGRE